MPLTKEQLLMPRVKCVIRYPDSRFPVGAILYQDFEDPELYNFIDANKRLWILESPQLYPETFIPLPWWSDRGISDLPEYVKRSDGSIVRVLHYGYSEGEGELYLVIDDLEIPNYMDYLSPEPSTLEEYAAYINQKQQ